jgi:WD40 repeat protein
VRISVFELDQSTRFCNHLVKVYALLQDFTNAVMDVDFSPTGREFVAASYDRSVRIFPFNRGHSREVYTAKRMQRVFAARFTGDASYIVTGSDDFNMRVWKVRISQYMRSHCRSGYHCCMKHSPRRCKQPVSWMRVKSCIASVGARKWAPLVEDLLEWLSGLSALSSTLYM